MKNDVVIREDGPKPIRCPRCGKETNTFYKLVAGWSAPACCKQRVRIGDVPSEDYLVEVEPQELERMGIYVGKKRRSQKKGKAYSKQYMPVTSPVDDDTEGGGQQQSSTQSSASHDLAREVLHLPGSSGGRSSSPPPFKRGMADEALKSEGMSAFKDEISLTKMLEELLETYQINAPAAVTILRFSARAEENGLYLTPEKLSHLMESLDTGLKQKAIPVFLEEYQLLVEKYKQEKEREKSKVIDPLRRPMFSRDQSAFHSSPSPSFSRQPSPARPASQSPFQEMISLLEYSDRRAQMMAEMQVQMAQVLQTLPEMIARSVQQVVAAQQQQQPSRDDRVDFYIKYLEDQLKTTREELKEERKRMERLMQEYKEDISQLMEGHHKKFSKEELEIVDNVISTIARSRPLSSLMDAAVRIYELDTKKELAMQKVRGRKKSIDMSDSRDFGEILDPRFVEDEEESEIIDVDDEEVD